MAGDLSERQQSVLGAIEERDGSTIDEILPDVAGKGVDYETGHGLINCYRAVKEVLRRKAVREGKNPKPYEGREDGDTLDIAKLQEKLKTRRLSVLRVQPGGQAAKLGVKPGDVIVSYHGQKITTRQDLMRAKKAAENEDGITVVFQRSGKNIKLEFKPGPVGVVPAVSFDDPTFR